MTQDTWTDRLSEYVDGELDVATTRALELHLAGCAECRAIADDLRQVSSRGRALPALAPGADLWPGIESRIREDGVVPIRPRTRSRAAHLLAAARGGGAAAGPRVGWCGLWRDAPFAARPRGRQRADGGARHRQSSLCRSTMEPRSTSPPRQPWPTWK